jgi:hypothetical protein
LIDALALRGAKMDPIDRPSVETVPANVLQGDGGIAAVAAAAVLIRAYLHRLL